MREEGGGRRPHCTRTNVPSWPEVRSSISQSPCGSPMGSKLGGSTAKCGCRGVVVGRGAVAVLMCRWVSRSWAAEATGETLAWRRWGGSSGPGPSPSSFWSPDMRRALSQGARTRGAGGSWGACWQLGRAAGWCCNCSNLGDMRKQGGDRSPPALSTAPPDKFHPARLRHQRVSAATEVPAGAAQNLQSCA